MSKAPTGWGVKQTQTFPVTVTNTGTIVWPSRGTNEVDLDLHFASSAGGFLNQSAWVTSQAFALPADVGPNQSVTVNVTVTAPSSAGSFVLEAEMIKEHEFWFTQYQPGPDELGGRAEPERQGHGQQHRRRHVAIDGVQRGRPGPPLRDLHGWRPQPVALADQPGLLAAG